MVRTQFREEAPLRGESKDLCKKTDATGLTTAGYFAGTQSEGNGRKPIPGCLCCLIDKHRLVWPIRSPTKGISSLGPVLSQPFAEPPRNSP